LNDSTCNLNEKLEKSLNNTLSDDNRKFIYDTHKKYIEEELKKNMHYFVNMNKKCEENFVIRYVSNYRSIPYNKVDCGTLYAGTNYNSGDINFMTNIPFGYWYKINKYLDLRFEHNNFEKDILFYGILNLPIEYFNSIYSQYERYYDDNGWDLIIEEIEKEVEEERIDNEKLKKIEEERRIYYENHPIPKWEEYDEVYLDPKLYGTSGYEDGDCYNPDNYLSDSSDSD
jgi:hypothetical protein